MAGFFATQLSFSSPYCSAANTLHSGRSSGQILGRLWVCHFSSHKQPEGYGHVKHVPGDAVEESSLVRASAVKDFAREPTAQCHPQYRCRKHKADAKAG